MTFAGKSRRKKLTASDWLSGYGWPPLRTYPEIQTAYGSHFLQITKVVTDFISICGSRRNDSHPPATFVLILLLMHIPPRLAEYIMGKHQGWNTALHEDW